MFSFVLLFAFVSCVFAVKYNQHEAKQLLYYSAIAYCNATELKEAFDCNACHQATNNATVYQTMNGTGNIFAYVLIDYEHEAIVLTFRGTNPTDLKNWITDLNYFRMPYPPANNSTVLVHEGFWENYATIEPSPDFVIREAIKKFPKYKVIVTGHSLGAALALLATMDLVGDKIVPLSKLTMYNFGQPRVGNDAFAQFAIDLLGVEHYRVIHNADLVPHLPPTQFGFHHIGTEVWYDEAMVSYRVCDGSGEDPTCSNSLWLKWGVTDHIYYFNVRVGSDCVVTLADIQRSMARPPARRVY